MPSFTLAILEDRIWSQLDFNVQEWPEPNLRLAINQALMYLGIVGYAQATVGIQTNTVASQLQYDVPQGIFIPTTVSWEGSEIERYSLERLARSFPGTWCTDQSSVYGPPARWASVGLKRFVLHPLDTFGGNLLEVTGIANVKPLVNPDDVIQVEDEFAEIVIMYSKVRLTFKEGGKAFADAVAQWKPMMEKIKSMARWRLAEWTLQEIEVRTAQGSGRWPR